MNLNLLFGKAVKLLAHYLTKLLYRILSIYAINGSPEMTTDIRIRKINSALGFLYATVNRIEEAVEGTDLADIVGRSTVQCIREAGGLRAHADNPFSAFDYMYLSMAGRPADRKSSAAMSLEKRLNLLAEAKTFLESATQLLEEASHLTTFEKKVTENVVNIYKYILGTAHRSVKPMWRIYTQAAEPPIKMKEVENRLRKSFKRQENLKRQAA